MDAEPASTGGLVIAAPLLHGPALAARADVAHGFTTRAGGVSEGGLATLNLGRRADEFDARLDENWDRVARALDPALDRRTVAILSQVHGADVVRVTAPRGPHAPIADADASYTTERGVILAVRVADCVPVLIAGPGGVAVAHAGWRGTAANIVRATVQALAEATGDDPSAMVATVGPHISADVFEVGEEVVDALRAAGLDVDRLVVRRAPKPYVDLGAAVETQLHDAGVPIVDRLNVCSVRDARFYSHRRDGAGCGRMAGVIVRR